MAPSHFFVLPLFSSFKAAFGGWSGAVSGQKSSEVIQMVYDFFSYVSQPSQSIPDVLAGDSGTVR
jgi:hypothetical protein